MSEASTKPCGKCGSSDRYSSGACKQCRRNNPGAYKKHQSTYYNKHKGTLREKRKVIDPVVKRNYKLKSVYGISEESRLHMEEAQGGVCAICKKEEAVLGRGGRPKLLAVDHDHATGQVRGLLCTNCNAGLGHFRDSVELLQAATLYITNGAAWEANKGS